MESVGLERGGGSRLTEGVGLNGLPFSGLAERSRRERGGWVFSALLVVFDEGERSIDDHFANFFLVKRKLSSPSCVSSTLKKNPSTILLPVPKYQPKKKHIHIYIYICSYRFIHTYAHTCIQSYRGGGAAERGREATDREKKKRKRENKKGLYGIETGEAVGIDTDRQIDTYSYLRLSL